MVPPSSDRIARVPPYFLVPLVAPPTFQVRGSHPLRPPAPERSLKSTATKYRLLPVRSPLLGESRLISAPTVTEMFQFSAFALPTLLDSGESDPYGPGFPIRTSPDQSSFASSPGLNAGCHVLHRL